MLKNYKTFESVKAKVDKRVFEYTGKYPWEYSWKWMIALQIKNILDKNL